MGWRDEGEGEIQGWGAGGDESEGEVCGNGGEVEVLERRRSEGKDSVDRGRRGGEVRPCKTPTCQISYLRRTSLKQTRCTK